MTRRPNNPDHRRPVIGVGGVVFEQGRVLLARRGAPPAKGFWSIPGGKLSMGETLEQGVARELREETGLEVRVGCLVAVYERLPRPEDPSPLHFVVLDYLCERCGGRLMAGDDAAEVGWFDLGALSDLSLTTGARDVILRARQLARNR